MLVTFRVKNIVSFCVKKLLHFALRSCYILRQKLLHFRLVLHFASKVVTFRVNVTFCVNCYILRRNRGGTYSKGEVTVNGLRSGQLFGIGHLFKEIRYSTLGI